MDVYISYLLYSSAEMKLHVIFECVYNVVKNLQVVNLLTNRLQFHKSTPVASGKVTVKVFPKTHVIIL